MYNRPISNPGLDPGPTLPKRLAFQPTYTQTQASAQHEVTQPPETMQAAPAILEETQQTKLPGIVPKPY